MDPRHPRNPNEPPPNPVFDWIHERFRPATKDSIATPEEKERIKKLERELEEMLQRENAKPRKDRFLPMLVVRAALSDDGTRPISIPFWESPDIWTADGDPSTTPAIPSNPGGTVTAGQPTTLYAHVWNLGLAPIVGVRVEFYWFDPTFAFNTPNAHLIGTASVDLAPRTSLQCHALVKCKAPWIPTFVNGGHECLVVRVSSIGDPIGTNEWEAWGNRHVAQRNISVTDVGEDVSSIMRALEKSRGKTRVQLLQIGADAGALPVELLAPGLRIDPNVKTRILAELDVTGRLTIPLIRAGSAGLAADAKRTEPIDQTASLDVRRIAPSTLLSLKRDNGQQQRESVKPPSKGEDWTVLAEGATLFDLLRYDEILSASSRKRTGRALPAPKRGYAQVLRLVSFEGDRMVGGYTIVIGRGREHS